MIRVALIDSGVAERHAGRVAAARSFPSGAACEDGVAAVLGGVLPHGPALAEVLLADTRIELLVARVFFGALATSAAQLAAAIDWAVARGAAVVNVSAGLHEDREPLGRAVARAVASGALVVAAAPARGVPVYPAAYPGVVRATGDARCAPGEWSWLASAQAEFGAHVRAGEVQGASAGCARVAARLAALLADGVSPEVGLETLRAQAHYRGAERRTG
jgi:hypothetical protein